MTRLAVGFEALQTWGGEALGDTRCVLAGVPDGGLHPASATCFLAPWLRASLETWLVVGTKQEARGGPRPPSWRVTSSQGVLVPSALPPAEGSTALFLLFSKMLQYVFYRKSDGRQRPKEALEAPCPPGPALPCPSAFFTPVAPSWGHCLWPKLLSPRAASGVNHPG